MEKDKIEIGDMVRVQWENMPTIYEAVVLSIPQGVGDVWRLKDLTTNEIVNVCLYGKMTLLRKGTV